MKNYFLILAAFCLVAFWSCSENPGIEDDITEQTPDDGSDNEGEDNNKSEEDDNTPDGDDDTETPSDAIPFNEIHYTSADGNIVEPFSGEFALEYPFGEGISVISNVYENGRGVITCNGDIKVIGDYAFFKCDNLETVIVPNSVTVIGESAFDLSGLTSISLPKGLTSVGEHAFAYTPLTNITIPDSVTTIGDAALRWCTKMKHITLPKGLTTLEFQVLYYCHELESLTIPDNVTTIKESALSVCAGLTALTIPDSVTTIEDWAISACYGLTSVTISRNIKTIGAMAFDQCNNLTGIYCKAVTPPSLEVSAFNRTNDAPIYVPAESVEAYKTAEGWSEYADRIYGYDFND